MKTPGFRLTILSAVLSLFCSFALGDTLELDDGTVFENCHVRDEGIRFLVWESMDKVGTGDYLEFPRSRLAPRLTKGRKVIRKTKNGDVERVENKNPLIYPLEDWDTRPQLPDLSVTFIEMKPKRAGLHMRVQYNKYGAPRIGGAPLLDKRARELGEQEKYLEPEHIVQDLKLEYKPDEVVTLAAHVKNFGFVDSKPFKYRWLIDEKEVATGSFEEAIKELDEVTFEYKYEWQEGRHTATFEVLTDQDEISTINNRATDPLWGFGFIYIVNTKRVEMWHQQRTAYGTFSWEDYYRWHLDIMNLLFEASVFPSAPEGIIARMRLDRIIYLDDVNTESILKARVAEDGIGYDQGAWIWQDSKEEKTGIWEGQYTQRVTEWSLPHELGHQLGLADYYVIDYPGNENHTWPDNGLKICHFQNHPIAMMHWHGPQPFSEATAMYLNMTWDKPRGHYADYYFAIPDENFLRIVDINGRGVPEANIEIYQRGAEVDPKAKARVDHGVTWYPLIEDGNFNKPVSDDPVIVGTTDDEGIIRLPNREVWEVKTLNGYHRKPNPFGNVKWSRALMLVKVTKYDRPTWFWLETVDFNLAWARGQKDKYTTVLETPYGSVDSPRPPLNVKWEYTDKTKKRVRVTWDKAKVREQIYLERPVAYRVYRRFGDMGLNDRPWFPVATVNASTFDFIVDLDLMQVNDIAWYTRTNRFAVSTVGELGIESEMVQAAQIDAETK